MKTFFIFKYLSNMHYLIRRRRSKFRLGKYSAIFTEPEVNNCFSIIFKEECEKREESLAYHEKQMSLSLEIMPRNPIHNHRARGDYNAELLYSLLKISVNIINHHHFSLPQWHYKHNKGDVWQTRASQFRELRHQRDKMLED